MVNGADAAALAAAKSCANIEDTFTPESRADIYAAANVSDLVAENGGVTDIEGCDDGPGYVTVQYSTPQSVFFGGVLGLDDTAPVTASATAAWGPAASAFAAPIVLDSGYLQGVCKVPDGVQIGDTCAFWYNNGDATLGDATWGFMNLDQWDVEPTNTAATRAVLACGLDHRRLPGRREPQRVARRLRTHVCLQRHGSLQCRLVDAP